jgi:hypothetical protein
MNRRLTVAAVATLCLTAGGKGGPGIVIIRFAAGAGGK